MGLPLDHKRPLSRSRREEKKAVPVMVMMVVTRWDSSSRASDLHVASADRGFQEARHESSGLHNRSVPDRATSSGERCGEVHRIERRATEEPAALGCEAAEGRGPMPLDVKFLCSSGDPLAGTRGSHAQSRPSQHARLACVDKSAGAQMESLVDGHRGTERSGRVAWLVRRRVPLHRRRRGGERERRRAARIAAHVGHPGSAPRQDAAHAAEVTAAPRTRVAPTPTPPPPSPGGRSRAPAPSRMAGPRRSAPPAVSPLESQCAIVQRVRQSGPCPHFNRRSDVGGGSVRFLRRHLPSSAAAAAINLPLDEGRTRPLPPAPVRVFSQCGVAAPDETIHSLHLRGGRSP
ncbi:unnamed protein product [Lampetra planeri]